MFMMTMTTIHVSVNLPQLLQVACAAVSFEIRFTFDLISLPNGRIACAQAAQIFFCKSG
jgi:hypothetical protein